MDNTVLATGWQQDQPDSRDKTVKDLAKALSVDDENFIWQEIIQVPKREEYSLDASCPEVYDQLTLGSCVANAVTAALRFAWKNSAEHIAAPYTDFSPSRLWIYYYARFMSNQTEYDEGTQVRDAIKSLKKYGICEESVFPYPEDHVKQAVKVNGRWVLPEKHPARDRPPPIAIDNSKTFFDFKFEYYRIRNLYDDLVHRDHGPTVTEQVRWSINEGFPVILAFAGYEEYKIGDLKNWPNNQLIEFPLGQKKKRSGGHAVLAVGFDNKRKAFKVQNSWSTKHGEEGFFWIPYSWFEETDGPGQDFWDQPVYDLWVIRPQFGPLLRDHDP